MRGKESEEDQNQWGKREGQAKAFSPPNDERRDARREEEEESERG